MTIEEWFSKAPITTVVVLLVLAALVVAMIYTFARLLLNSLADSARTEQPVSMLMWILGILSIVALIGGLFTSNEQAFTIAATGAGAFAGALTARAQAVIPDEPEIEPELEPELVVEELVPPGDVRNPLPPLRVDDTDVPEDD